MFRGGIVLAIAVLVSGCAGLGGSQTAATSGTVARRPAGHHSRPGHRRSTGSGRQSQTGGRQSTIVKTTAAPSHAVVRRRNCSSTRLGSLPQTSTLPSTHTPAFRCEMAALWAGIRTGTVGPAMPAFFPEAAYAQIKGIADPQGDWADRLVADYNLDLQAAHALLGSGAAHARLVEVIVPPSFPHMIPPGVCYNRYGYWETPNSRLVYRENGTVSSVGIASMISWHGAWFVVHLGAILRNGAGGEVDAPSAGVGVATPSGTC